MFKDLETKQIIDKNKDLVEMLGSRGWATARGILLAKILDLQNAFNIEDSDPQKMVTDLMSRKIATNVLVEFLREVEGSKEVIEQNAPSRSHIVNLEE